jgi:hypothetical protein
LLRTAFLLTVAPEELTDVSAQPPRYNTAMRMVSLQSGSNGNCIYVEAGGVRILFDAGISGRQAGY